MAKGRRRKRSDDDEKIKWGKPKKIKSKEEAEDRLAHLPKRPAFGSGGSGPLGYATLTHGNVLSWNQLRAAQGHNSRTQETPNARSDAPEPIELLEGVSGSYEDRVKAVLTAHNVPHKLRKGGVLATEDIYGASPEYWNRDGDWKQKPLSEIINDPVVQAAVRLAKRKHGDTLISCSLHVDEESPHVHVVAVPIYYRWHTMRGRKPKDCKKDADGNWIDDRKIWKASLFASATRGLSSQLEQNHDDWAAECADLRLIRGAKGSELTEMARRARRSRQTGRACKVEQEARLDREALMTIAEAEAARVLENAEGKIAEIFNYGNAALELRRQEVEGRERSVSARLMEVEERERTASDLLAMAVEKREEAERDAEAARKEREAVKAAADQQLALNELFARITRDLQSDRDAAAADRQAAKKEREESAAEREASAEANEAMKSAAQTEADQTRKDAEEYAFRKRSEAEEDRTAAVSTLGKARAAEHLVAQRAKFVEKRERSVSQRENAARQAEAELSRREAAVERHVEAKVAERLASWSSEVAASLRALNEWMPIIDTFVQRYHRSTGIERQAMEQSGIGPAAAAAAKADEDYRAALRLSEAMRQQMKPGR